MFKYGEHTVGKQEQLQFVHAWLQTQSDIDRKGLQEWRQSPYWQSGQSDRLHSHEPYAKPFQKGLVQDIQERR